MSIRTKQLNAAIAVAQSLAARPVTCEGCIGLRRYPRPMCREESSPHFRTARDTYHNRCSSYSVGRREEPGAQPAAPAAMNNAQVVVRGRGT